MCPKWLITVALAGVWGTYEYFTQFGPFGHMPFSWWLPFSIIMWAGGFWFFDIVKAQIQPKSPAKPPEKPATTWRSISMRLLGRVYLWIPLLLLIYFLYRHFGAAKVSAWFLWEVKIFIDIIVMVKVRKFLVKRYCADKPPHTTGHKL